MTATIFALDGLDDFRIEFVVKDGKAVELIGLYDNGEREPSSADEIGRLPGYRSVPGAVVSVTRGAGPGAKSSRLAKTIAATAETSAL